MSTSKLAEKLDDFFDLSKKKRTKKHEKLLKIIQKLEDKKTELKVELAAKSKVNETSTWQHDLIQELKVISKLIRKAKNHDMAN